MINNTNANAPHTPLQPIAKEMVEASHPEVQDRFHAYEDDTAGKSAEARGWDVITTEKRASYMDSRDQHQQMTSRGWSADDPQVVALANEVARKRESLEAANESGAAANKKAGVSRDVLNGSRRYLNGFAARSAVKQVATGPLKAPGLGFVPVVLPPDIDLRALVANEQKKQQELAARAREVEAAGPTKEQHEAEVTEAMDALREQGEREGLYVSLFEAAALRFQVVSVEAEPSRPGNYPTAPNLAPLLVSLFYEPLLARALKQVAAHHAVPGGLKMSADEKAAELARLRQETLASERIECGALWALRAEGENVAFRHNTDPRALLGIETIPSRRKD